MSKVPESEEVELPSVGVQEMKDESIRSLRGVVEETAQILGCVPKSIPGAVRELWESRGEWMVRAGEKTSAGMGSMGVPGYAPVCGVDDGAPDGRGVALKVRDVVRLRSRGPWMTIETIDGLESPEGVMTIWWCERTGKIRTRWFDKNVLVKVEE